MTRTEIDASVAGEESPDASETLETGDSVDQAFERLETSIAIGLERFTNQCIRDSCMAAVLVVVLLKLL